MHSFTERFAAYCEENLDLNKEENYPYQSLPVCILDCVYSLRARYGSAVNVVKRYADVYGDANKSGDTISMFLQRIEEAGGAEKFANTLDNHQKSGGKNAILKSVVCFQLAKYLRCLHIETTEDFQEFECPQLLENVVRSVKGMGEAGVQYLFMLTGDKNRCKPDVYVHRCIQDACDHDISDAQCQILFRDTVQVLREKHPELSLTVRALDGIIWNKYKNKK
mgnify:CR=1 FL=1